MGLYVNPGEYVYHLTCDQCGIRFKKEYGSLRKTISKATKKGWKLEHNGQDFCPICILS